jgi:hypothetical protein
VDAELESSEAVAAVAAAEAEVFSDLALVLHPRSPVLPPSRVADIRRNSEAEVPRGRIPFIVYAPQAEL